MTGLTHLKSFQALELALKLGSLNQAALKLSITPAAVGQRIKSLEEYLGIELLVRGRAGLRPTAELSKAMGHLSRGFEELAKVAEVLDFQRANEIHIAANVDFVKLWLQPRLEVFKKENPNILFCVNGEGDVPRRLGQLDCEISFAEQASDEEGDWIGNEILFRDYLLPISSHENTDRVLRLRKKYKLEGFPLLHLDFYKNDPAAIDWPSWFESYGYRETALNRGFRFQGISAALEAMTSNAGMLVSGLALITHQLDRNEYSLPFPITRGAWTEHAYQAHFPKLARQRPQVKHFRRWLLEQAQHTNEWIMMKLS
ncbi:MAG: LysR family transcriptional regulator [SAR86 cluster bacterium]|uniref:LysR family transcriptional regulator n=1 Tax=SAR86 cluster bacterium TaxID=2030880 RepID=A0A2A4MN70_9GAMM|nr:MAG: LysR family transcriptional regulator [SAR86 cluster bacterium]